MLGLLCPECSIIEITRVVNLSFEIQTCETDFMYHVINVLCTTCEGKSFARKGSLAEVEDGV